MSVDPIACMYRPFKVLLIESFVGISVGQLQNTSLLIRTLQGTVSFTTLGWKHYIFLLSIAYSLFSILTNYI